jgi:hypothetical protein
VAYFDVFEVALTAKDLGWLVMGKKSSEEQVREIIKNSSNLKLNGERVTLAGREELANVSDQKRELADQLIEKVRRWAGWFRHVPFVQGVAVCNYLPLGVVDDHSDIDLFVVTRKGRIFMARVFLTLLTHLLGKRRHGGKVEGRFCLSFYANEENLSFQELLIKDGDIYFAYWTLALLPMFGDRRLWEKLADENWQWGKDFFVDWQNRFNFQEVNTKKAWSAKAWEYLLGGRLGNWVERKLVSYFQKRHAQKKANLPDNASVIVNSKWLKYHNNDRREWFKEEWLERLKRFKISE